MAEEKHVLSILVDNQPGVLSRIVGLFSGRGYNIESLCVAETTDPLVSRMTIVTKADPLAIEQINKQLNKLINVVKVHELTGTEYVEREMALIKVKGPAGTSRRNLTHRRYFPVQGRGCRAGGTTPSRSPVTRAS